MELAGIGPHSGDEAVRLGQGGARRVRTKPPVRSEGGAGLITLVLPASRSGNRKILVLCTRQRITRDSGYEEPVACSDLGGGLRRGRGAYAVLTLRRGEPLNSA